MTPANPTKHATTCKHCGQVFRAFTFGLPEKEAPPPDRLIQFVMALGNHLGSHTEAYQKLAGTLQEFSGMLIVAEYSTDDPGLLARFDATRADVHQETRKHFIDDAGLATIVSRMGPSPTPETVLAVMTELRNTYEELGDYAPKFKPETVQLKA